MKPVRVGKNTFIILILITLFRLMLDWCYFHVITIQYGYSGFINNRSFYTTLLSWAILLAYLPVIYALQSTKKNHGSNLILLYWYLVSFVPCTTCICAGIFDSSSLIYICIFWMTMFVLQRRLQKKSLRSRQFVFGRLRLNDRVILLIGLFSVAITLFVSWRYTHFRMNFGLFNVYDLRLEAREFSMPRLLKYLFTWTRAINPVLFGYCLIHRKRALATLFFMTQMLSFGIDGMKSVLFMPFLMIGVILAFRFGYTLKHFKMLIIIGVVSLSVLAVLEVLLLKRNLIISVVIRRMFFLPNYLHECYLEFFRSNTPDYFRSSFLRWFGFKSPYTTNAAGITYIIGERYFGNANANANNGLISDAVTNFGNAGAVLMPCLFAVFLWMFDRCTAKLDPRFVSVASLYCAFSIMSTFLSKALLTHGILVLMLLFTIMEPEELKEDSIQKRKVSRKIRAV